MRKLLFILLTILPFIASGQAAEFVEDGDTVVKTDLTDYSWIYVDEVGPVANSSKAISRS